MSRTPPLGNARSMRAEAAFRARLTDFGATLLEPEWLGALAPHRILCVNGHEVTKRPAGVQQGQGVCRNCRKSQSLNSEATFHARLAELGVTLRDREWRGSDVYYKATCPEGHECVYCPNDLTRGRGGCRTCGQRKAGSILRSKGEADFRARLTEMGAVLLEPGYRGSTADHLVRCARGHETLRRPVETVRTGNVCNICTGRNSEAAEQAFRQRLAELGATLVEPRWLGTSRPHRVICTEGHECRPTPNNASKYGICLRCRGWDSNAFYVLTNEHAGTLKLGITTGAGRQRMNRHAADGFTTLHRFLAALPGGVAPVLERHVLATLRLAGERPVQGREYFPSSVLATVLDVVDHYPISKTSGTRKDTA
ncbi:hypothetical protein [Streptomyces sp. NPDC057250]|uniref:hypothetical protein n=1 Tax=Streptomyces sp. NPDC057250 TaxID=3346068 RepID=UPI00362DD412